MRLKSVTLLRALVGPEPDKKMSGRRLAQQIGKNPSFISHLMTGRMNTCSPETASKISAALGVKLCTLFLVPVSTSERNSDNRKDSVA